MQTAGCQKFTKEFFCLYITSLYILGMQVFFVILPGGARPFATGHCLLVR